MRFLSRYLGVLLLLGVFAAVAIVALGIEFGFKRVLDVVRSDWMDALLIPILAVPVTAVWVLDRKKRSA